MLSADLSVTPWRKFPRRQDVCVCVYPSVYKRNLMGLDRHTPVRSQTRDFRPWRQGTLLMFQIVKWGGNLIFKGVKKTWKEANCRQFKITPFTLSNYKTPAPNTERFGWSTRDLAVFCFLSSSHCLFTGKSVSIFLRAAQEIYTQHLHKRFLEAASQKSSSLLSHWLFWSRRDCSKACIDFCLYILIHTLLYIVYINKYIYM